MRPSGRFVFLPINLPTIEFVAGEVALRVPKGVVCLLSALRAHGLGTQAPFEVWLAIDNRASIPRPDQPKIRPLWRLGLGSNRPLLGAVLLTFALQMATIYVPVLHPIFKTQALSAVELLICLAAAACVGAAVEIEKALRRRRLVTRSGGRELSAAARRQQRPPDECESSHQSIRSSR